jgi:hypothetical protein
MRHARLTALILALAGIGTLPTPVLADAGTPRVSIQICAANRQDGQRNYPSKCSRSFRAGTPLLYIAVSGLPHGAQWQAVVSISGAVIARQLAAARREPSVTAFRAISLKPGEYTVTVLLAQDRDAKPKAVGTARFSITPPGR